MELKWQNVQTNCEYQGIFFFFFNLKTVLLNTPAKIMCPISLKSFTSCYIPGFLSLSYGLLFCRKGISCRYDGCWSPASPTEECRTSASDTLLFWSPDKNSITTSFKLKGKGAFLTLRSCFQVTTPCHCENVSKRQRSFWASGKPHLPRLKHPWAAAWLQVKPSQGKGENKLNTGGLKHGQLRDSTQIPIQVTDSGITQQTTRQLATSTRNQGGFSF